ncbi:MAG: Exopolyphosphatase-related protein [Parcubacteria group bacterium GW2011_GWC2_45_7]|nr:MAG: Exopolyphosphatase-related protein [Parcubacteria group bacterium GW2011_GWC2_45_7]KKU73071.1 MAG: Exopolyphosphatase-related protein [Parcubacteria group bacterium GW2011_GWA2_47_26]
MAQDTIQQITQRLQDAEHILITFPYLEDIKESGDALGSALALFGYLQNLGKKADIVVNNFKTNERLAFLPNIQRVQGGLLQPRNYTLRIKSDNAKLKELSYGIKDGSLEIYLTPDNGVLTHEDIELQRNRYKYDTIITLDTPDLSLLGKVFEGHTELFYGTPIINIDHHASNEEYGQINLIDINATSTGEILAALLKTIGSHHLDKNIATNLFAAIFLKTHGFKTPTISPNTLKIAAELLQLGARREDIMKHVFRSRTLSSLRLWGKTLAHLKYDPVLEFTWSTLTQREILDSGGALQELPDVIEELIFTSPEAATVALIYEETEKRICALIASKKTSSHLRALPWTVLETTSNCTKFCLLNHTLISAEQEIMEKIKGALKLFPTRG